jgi:hypothetical protein
MLSTTTIIIIINLILENEYIVIRPWSKIESRLNWTRKKS